MVNCHGTRHRNHLTTNYRKTGQPTKHHRHQHMLKFMFGLPLCWSTDLDLTEYPAHHVNIPKLTCSPPGIDYNVSDELVGLALQDGIMMLLSYNRSLMTFLNNETPFQVTRLNSSFLNFRPWIMFHPARNCCKACAPDRGQNRLSWYRNSWHLARDKGRT